MRFRCSARSRSAKLLAMVPSFRFSSAAALEDAAATCADAVAADADADASGAASGAAAAAVGASAAEGVIFAPSGGRASVDCAFCGVAAAATTASTAAAEALNCAHTVHEARPDGSKTSVRYWRFVELAPVWDGMAVKTGSAIQKAAMRTASGDCIASAFAIVLYVIEGGRFKIRLVQYVIIRVPCFSLAIWPL
jgi:hypothetical protein